MMISGYLFYRENIVEAYDEEMAVAFENMPLQGQEQLVYAARQVLIGQKRRFDKRGIVIPQKKEK